MLRRKNTALESRDPGWSVVCSHTDTWRRRMPPQFPHFGSGKTPCEDLNVLSSSEILKSSMDICEIYRFPFSSLKG